eukprot:jgi/Tetstr1/460360/TSEL_005659.t1
MARRKTLLQELAGLDNPAPCVDPEEDIFGSGAVLPAEDEDDQLSEGRLAQPGKGKSSGLIMRGDIDVSDLGYSGRQTSRSERNRDAPGSSDDGEVLEDDGEDEEESDEGGAEEEEEGEENGRFMLGGASGQHTADQRETASSLEDEEQAGDADGRLAGQLHQGDGRDDSDGLEDNEEELRAVMMKRAAADAVKGKGVAAQQRYHKEFLECRVQLQQVLEGSNRMPEGFRLADACEFDEPIREAKTALARSLVEVLASLDDIQNSSVAASPAINRDQPPTLPADVDREWQHLEATWNAKSQYVTDSIDRWHRKTVLGSGGAALRSKLKALDKAPSQQAGQPGRDERDEETFEDTEFYQVALKDYLESQLGNASVAARPSSKRKNQVDRRASKGRKLRYDAHEKLVNFMTPAEHCVPGFPPSVFSNMFGMRSS